MKTCLLCGTAHETTGCPQPRCRKCGTEMVTSIAIQQTWTAGIPDFIGDKNPIIQTMSPGGPGELIPCLKCPACGYSTTK